MAPAKLPPAIAKKIHEEFTAAVKDPKVIKKLADIGCDVDPTTMENFDRSVRRETRAGAPLSVKQHHRRLIQASQRWSPPPLFSSGTRHTALALDFLVALGGESPGRKG